MFTITCKKTGYMTIQIRTTQIPTIQILEKIFKTLYLKKCYKLEKNKKAYIYLINIYKPIFLFCKILNIF